MKEHWFNPGDVVTCIDNFGAIKTLNLGGTYTVKRCYRDRDNDTMVELFNLRDNNGYFARRFELVDLMEDTRAYLESITNDPRLECA